MTLSRKIALWWFAIPSAVFFFFLGFGLFTFSSNDMSLLGLAITAFGPFLLIPILVTWPIAVILSAIITKQRGTFRQTGIRKYHFVLAAFMLAAFGILVAGFIKQHAQRNVESTHWERIISQAGDPATPPSEIVALYGRKIEITHPFWQMKLEESIAQNVSASPELLGTLFGQYIQEDGGLIPKGRRTFESLAENPSTPDDILLKLLDLPVFSGYGITTREKISEQAAETLAVKGYRCALFNAPEKMIFTGERFFSCTK